MKRVVSISLGASKRDSTSQVDLLGETFEVSRIGTDGDMKRFAEKMSELDGKVDAIGLGGIDRYVWADKRRYTIRDADRLARIAKVTPVVDGSGVKNTLERKTIQYLQDQRTVDFAHSKVLVVCAVDRFGMAQTIAKYATDVVYGDMMFSLGIPVPMRSYGTVRVAASVLMPIIARLPFQWIYPTGAKQEKSEPKYQKYYDWADVIAGDYHFVKRTIPTVESGLLEGKTLITNTLTPEDTRMLADRKLGMFVTSIPEQMKSPDGRYYATNVFEGVLITLLGKKPEDVSPEDYDPLLERMNWQPTIVDSRR
jgi:hypothetical protein